MVAESWLNHCATNTNRGRVLSVYIIVMNDAFAAVALAVLALFALYRVVRGLAKPVD